MQESYPALQERQQPQQSGRPPSHAADAATSEEKILTSHSFLSTIVPLATSQDTFERAGQLYDLFRLGEITQHGDSC
jgi:hypothetical protein